MNKQNNWFFILGWALILALWLFFMGFFISQGNMAQWPYGMANSITVMGEGKASVTPDTLIINVSISELASTTELAQKQSNEKVTKLKTLLSELAVPEKDLKSMSVNVSPEYDRNDTNGRKLLGYRSQHSLSITLTGEAFAEIWGEIVEEISKIGGVNIDGTIFDVKDKNAGLAGAREKALEDAHEKAEQLVKASGGKLGKVLTIQDNTYYNMPWPIYYARNEKMAMGGDMDAAVESTPFSPGESEVIVNVNVVYKIK